MYAMTNVTRPKRASAVGGQHHQVGPLVFHQSMDLSGGFTLMNQRIGMDAGKLGVRKILDAFLFVGTDPLRPMGIEQPSLVVSGFAVPVGVQQGELSGEVRGHIADVGHHGPARCGVIHGKENGSKRQHYSSVFRAVSNFAATVHNI